MNKKIFITRNILPEGIELLKSKNFQVEVNSLDRPLSCEELTIKAQEVDALITMLSDCIDKTFLEKNSHLKVIANYAVGYNNIDLKEAHRLNIKITNTPDVLTEATAEVAFGLMIASARNFLEAHQSSRAGEWKNWNPTGHLGLGLRGKTLGIIGLGRIGFRMAEMASSAFKMPVLYTARSEKSTPFKANLVGLDELLTKSDFISLHVPMNEKTKYLIGEKEFLKMKKTAILINTSRGEIINQEALITALKEKRLFAAGLDVTDPEPLELTNPLWTLPNAFVLPHIGSATYEARREMSLLCAKNVIAALKGEELISEVK